MGTLKQAYPLPVCFVGAHHIDLRPATPEDPDWLVEQRATEIRLIEGWLNDYNSAKTLVFDM